MPLWRPVLAAAALCLLLTNAAPAAWKPPKDPNPDRILSEARDDTAAGRYADALEKHVWFHENALKYAPAMYGVRLSFALSYWKTLADAYPPALDALKAARDRAAEDVRAGKDVRHSFHDLAAINQTLEENAGTKEVFLWLDSERPRDAEKVFDVAERSLVEAKEFAVCGKYLDPDDSYSRMARIHQENLRLAKTDLGPELGDFGDRIFAHDAATLVALLVLNDRRPEAERIAQQALLESEDARLKLALDAALDGQLPPLFP
jgi:hypothetical protein